MTIFKQLTAALCVLACPSFCEGAQSSEEERTPAEVYERMRGLMESTGGHEYSWRDHLRVTYNSDDFEGGFDYLSHLLKANSALKASEGIENFQLSEHNQSSLIDEMAWIFLHSSEAAKHFYGKLMPLEQVIAAWKRSGEKAPEIKEYLEILIPFLDAVCQEPNIARHFDEMTLSELMRRYYLPLNLLPDHIPLGGIRRETYWDHFKFCIVLSARLGNSQFQHQLIKNLQNPALHPFFLKSILPLLKEGDVATQDLFNKLCYDAVSKGCEIFTSSFRGKAIQILNDLHGGDVNLGVKDWDRILQNYRTFLEQKDQELHEHEAATKAREASLEQKDQELHEHEAATKAREASLEQKAQELREREAASSVPVSPRRARTKKKEHAHHQSQSLTSHPKKDKEREIPQVAPLKSSPAASPQQESKDAEELTNIFTRIMTSPTPDDKDIGLLKAKVIATCQQTIQSFKEKPAPKHTGQTGVELTKLIAATCLRDNNPSAAKGWLQKAVNQGDAESMVDLAMLLLIENNFTDAEKHLKTATEKGNTDAKDLLPQVYLVNNKVSEFLECLTSSAEKGDHNTQSLLYLYHRSHGSTKAEQYAQSYSLNAEALDKMIPGLKTQEVPTQATTTTTTAQDIEAPVSGEGTHTIPEEKKKETTPSLSDNEPTKRVKRTLDRKASVTKLTKPTPSLSRRSSLSQLPVSEESTRTTPPLRRTQSVIQLPKAPESQGTKKEEDKDSQKGKSKDKKHFFSKSISLKSFIPQKKNKSVENDKKSTDSSQDEKSTRSKHSASQSKESTKKSRSTSRSHTPSVENSIEEKDPRQDPGQTLVSWGRLPEQPDQYFPRHTKRLHDILSHKFKLGEKDDQVTLEVILTAGSRKYQVTRAQILSLFSKGLVEPTDIRQTGSHIIIKGVALSPNFDGIKEGTYKGELEQIRKMLILNIASTLTRADYDAAYPQKSKPLN